MTTYKYLLFYLLIALNITLFILSIQLHHTMYSALISAIYLFSIIQFMKTIDTYHALLTKSIDNNKDLIEMLKEIQEAIK